MAKVELNRLQRRDYFMIHNELNFDEISLNEITVNVSHLIESYTIARS
jgi:phage-related minor tail protein